jgi:hypothetical protein
MANILYGVNGEGSGHSSRAREVITHLQAQGHRVHVASFDRGYHNLKDDFDVTETTFKTFPFRPSTLQPEHREALRSFVPRLVEAMAQNVAFKLNAGKRVGTYNLARCRGVTGSPDPLLGCLGPR